MFAGFAVLLYHGVSELHDLDRARSVGVVLGTSLLWVVLLLLVDAQIAAAGGV